MYSFPTVSTALFYKKVHSVFYFASLDVICYKRSHTVTDLKVVSVANVLLYVLVAC